MIEMGKEKPNVLEDPATGYLIRALIAYLGVNLFFLAFEYLFRQFLPEFSRGLGSIFASLCYMALFRLFNRKDYRGTLTVSFFVKGVRMLLPVGLLVVINFFASCSRGLTTRYVEALSLAMQAGFMEEVIFRTTAIAGVMKNVKEEKQIPALFFTSAVLFSLCHAFNLLAGADLLATVIQVVSALGLGLIFTAVYLRTADILPCILFHTLINFAAFLSEDLLSASGIVETPVTAVDVVYGIVSVFVGICGIAFVSPKYRGEITEIWKKRWNREE